MTFKVLVACECSGKVRDAFTKKGFDATSCDLKPTQIEGKHYQGDVRDILHDKWDLVVAFPPCTHLSCSGARHFEKKRLSGQQAEGHDFFMLFASLQCKYAIENPVGIMNKLWRPPNQIIQPWQFGHEAQKTTCLWLRGLPLLEPTKIVGKGEFTVFASGKRHPKWYADAFKKGEHGSIRSVTFDGIAEAMANQWGDYMMGKKECDMEDMFL